MVWDVACPEVRYQANSHGALLCTGADLVLLTVHADAGLRRPDGSYPGPLGVTDAFLFDTTVPRDLALVGVHSINRQPPRFEELHGPNRRSAVELPRALASALLRRVRLARGH